MSCWTRPPRRRQPSQDRFTRPGSPMRLISIVIAMVLAANTVGESRTSAHAAEKRHILVNWDGGSLERDMFSHRVKTDVTVMRQVLEDVVDEHARAGVDTYSHVVFAQFRSNLVESNVIQVTNWEPKLKAAGVDLARILMDRCHHHGMAFLACLRMNDRHENSVEARFWKEHPQWRLKEYRGGLDYKHEGVRDTVLTFIEEVLNNYNVDGIEFDYMRWCHVFSPAEATQNAPLLTDMTTKVRRLLDDTASRRGVDRLRLGVRVPQTMDECRALGFDVAEWVKLGLVDYVVPTDFFYTDLNTRVEEYVKLTEGTDCEIYPAVHPVICWGNSHQLMTLVNYRAAASNFYSRGAHGMSTFNYMYSWDKRRSPGYVGSGLMWPAALGYLRELADSMRVRQQDRHYLFHPLWPSRPAPTGVTKDDRIRLERGSTEVVGTQTFRLSEDLTDPKLRAVMQFKAVGLEESETLLIRLNGRPVEGSQITRVVDPDGQTEYEGRELDPFHLYVIDLPRGDTNPMLIDGDNELAVTLQSSDTPSEGGVTIDELEVYVYVSS